MEQLHFELGRQLWGSSPHLLKSPPIGVVKKWRDARRTISRAVASSPRGTVGQGQSKATYSRSDKPSPQFYLCHLELVLPSGIVHFAEPPRAWDSEFTTIPHFKKFVKQKSIFFSKNFFPFFNKILDNKPNL